MSWIKRNLYFLLGSLVAAGLLAVAILYLLQKEGADKQAMDALNQAYEELNRLNSLNPHPGSDKVDNIKTAKEQQGEVRAYLRKARDYFDSIHPIPDTTSVTTEDFTAQLRRTIDQLQKDASQASVT